jgi:hypothetical protein
MNPIAKASGPSRSSTLKTGTMFGCEKLAAIRVSRKNRSRSADSEANSDGSTLIATERSSCTSRAR